MTIVKLGIDKIFSLTPFIIQGRDPSNVISSALSLCFTVSDRRPLMSRDCFWLTKHQFARLKPLLPNDTRGKPRVDD